MDGVRTGEISVPAVRQSFDHAVGTPETCSLRDKLFVSGMLGVTEGDVVFDLSGDFFLGRQRSNRDRKTQTYRYWEQRIVLKQNCDRASQIIQFKVPDIAIIDPDGSFSCVVNASHQL